MKYVIKRGRRQPEKFDMKKLEKSLIGTCLAVRVPEGEAEDIARAACRDMDAWLQNKTEVTTTDIRHQATRTLAKLNKDAAYYYAEQKQII